MDRQLSKPIAEREHAPTRLDYERQTQIRDGMLQVGPRRTYA